MAIHFFEEEINARLKQRNSHKTWLKNCILAENGKKEHINFIFCDDAYLLNINKEYLQHDTYTDIITFDLSTKPNQLLADIFISVERVAENAEKFKIDYEQELRRVMVHGVLHLLGYKDKSKKDQEHMRAKENEYLQKFIDGK